MRFLRKLGISTVVTEIGESLPSVGDRSFDTENVE
jgi:hypothetical protein